MNIFIEYEFVEVEWIFLLNMNKFVEVEWIFCWILKQIDRQPYSYFKIFFCF
jgi:hypothetical protein